MSWQGEQKRLNTCSPAVASCANVVPVEAARAIPAITHVLIIFSFSRQVPAPGPPMPADPRSDESANGIGRPTAIPLFEWRQTACRSTAQGDNLFRRSGAKRIWQNGCDRAAL